MSYFKIYPQKILVESAVSDKHRARLFYNFEQYGYLYRDKNCALELRCDAVLPSQSKMIVLASDVQVKRFSEFISALNFYLFQILKYKPSGPRPETPLQPEEFFFQPVYFDILDGRIKKILSPVKARAAD